MTNTTLHPAQSEIAKDRHRFRVVNCGRRFGKTFLSVWEMFGYAVARGNARVAYIAPTYQQARDIAWSELKKITQPTQVVVNESRLEIRIRNVQGSESFLALRGWESIETLRGQSFDFIVFDEVSSYRDFWQNWHEVLRPTLTDRVGHALFISTPKGFNHFYELYNLEAKDADYKSFHFSTYDNPHLPKEEVDKARQELTEDRFAQEYLADFRKTEGLVYKEFERSRHIFKSTENKPYIKTFGGLDFGFTNPTAAITVKKDKYANYWITDEWYKRGQTDAQVADYVAALRWEECYPDPESPSGIEELKRRGVNTREVVKNKDSVKNGINTVRELFKANRLRIHESCTNLIWELETYSYPESRAGQNETEAPIKENDHALDALRYALSMDNALTVEQIHEPLFFHAVSENAVNPAE